MVLVKLIPLGQVIVVVLDTNDGNINSTANTTSMSKVERTITILLWGGEGWY